MNIQSIQSEPKQAGLDGGLFFDRHQRDPLAYHGLGLDLASLVTRCWYCFIPARGEPRGLTHLPGRPVLVVFETDLGNIKRTTCESE